MYFGTSLASPGINITCHASSEDNSTHTRANSRVWMKFSLWKKMETGSAFVTMLELSRPFVAPFINLFGATWIRRLP